MRLSEFRQKSNLKIAFWKREKLVFAYLNKLAIFIVRYICNVFLYSLLSLHDSLVSRISIINFLLFKNQYEEGNRRGGVLKRIRWNDVRPLRLRVRSSYKGRRRRTRPVCTAVASASHLNVPLHVTRNKLHQSHDIASTVRDKKVLR